MFYPLFNTNQPKEFIVSDADNMTTTNKIRATRIVEGLKDNKWEEEINCPQEEVNCPQEEVNCPQEEVNCPQE